ncbi:alpha/beta hydrolase fold domain-containing protein [Emcibacter nanhaiensis]|nr:alpha/beta hydrolase [Emcibacter nanhaiensis]
MTNNQTRPDRSILDPQTRAVVEMLEKDPFLDLSMTPAEMRLTFDRFYERIGYPDLPVAHVEDLEVPGKAGPIAVRLYYPLDGPEEKLPACVFYHGGGMMMGSIGAYDGLCRRLCAKSGAIVISSSYRLAPENKFPAAAEDAIAVFEWVYENAGRDAALQMR